MNVNLARKISPGINRNPVYLLSMDWQEAKKLIEQYRERQKVNVSWLADQIGEKPKQKVYNWLNGTNEPSDLNVWVRMANALGLNRSPVTAIEEQAHELALDILMEPNISEPLRLRAANLIRELAKKKV